MRDNPAPKRRSLPTRGRWKLTTLARKNVERTSPLISFPLRRLRCRPPGPDSLLPFQPDILSLLLALGSAGPRCFRSVPSFRRHRPSSLLPESDYPTSPISPLDERKREEAQVGRTEGLSERERKRGRRGKEDEREKESEKERERRRQSLTSGLRRGKKTAVGPWSRHPGEFLDSCTTFWANVPFCLSTASLSLSRPYPLLLPLPTERLSFFRPALATCRSLRQTRGSSTWRPLLFGTSVGRSERSSKISCLSYPAPSAQRPTSHRSHLRFALYSRTADDRMLDWARVIRRRTGGITRITAR